MKKILLIIVILFIPKLEVYANSIEDALNSISDKIQEIEPNLEKYPIGSIYMSTTSDNPSILFGGTWESYGTGRTLISAGGDYTAGNTGGATTKTLTTSNIPSHTHTFTATATVTSTFNGTNASVNSTSVSHTHSFNITNSGNISSTHGLSAGGSTLGYGGRVKVEASGSNTEIFASTASHTHTLTAAGSVSSTFSGSAKTTSSVGSGTSFSVLNPYITVYIWKRIS